MNATTKVNARPAVCSKAATRKPPIAIYRNKKPNVRHYAVHTGSSVTSVRPTIRNQLKLLRSTSNGILLMGLLSEVALFYVGLEGFFDKDFFTIVSTVIFAIGIGLIDLIIYGILRFCAAEINDQLKKLNEEA